eukprot:TRINITY_DN11529_c0_g1_i1.p1 TRINITY_DN11529_c0_g1~~TRINITY_DN11529_c0_g1_i1.p1  ORF type:complete len:126 (-),score=57.38 TRINITY_DN11529_c0_g1_i1:44-421(-)
MFFFFFFFKQKTAYEMLRSLVGSEMCIRDRYQRRVREYNTPNLYFPKPVRARTQAIIALKTCGFKLVDGCLLYTSDAADEEDSVDLGGRRIIKKKKKKKKMKIFLKKNKKTRKKKNKKNHIERKK